MEDGAKEDPVKRKEPKCLGKSGWVKKATGRLLASYKDRYVHVEKTEVVVYENKDLKNCLERLDLENYERCQELKSPFKKKHRLILIRSPKSGNKVDDVKFQAPNAEDKQSWIKALSAAIDRTKNKILDEVKIDESLNLEHVTRTRPKGIRNRRPPTRIHMKQRSSMSSDGILTFDADFEEVLISNGSHHASSDGIEVAKDDIQVPMPLSNAGEAKEEQSGSVHDEMAHSEPKVRPQKKAIKPPSVPKEANPITPPEDDPDRTDGPRKKVLKPPMPPSKEAKPCVITVHKGIEIAKNEKMCGKSPDLKKMISPPATLPNECSSGTSTSPRKEVTQSNPNSCPPMPPSKEKKPSHRPATVSQKVKISTNETEQALPSMRYDKPESTTAEEQSSEEESMDIRSMNRKSANKTATELLRMSPSSLLTLEEKPEELVPPYTQGKEIKKRKMQSTDGKDPASLLQTTSDTLASSSQAESGNTDSEVPSLVVCSTDPVSNSLNMSPVLSPLQGEKKKMGEEEKSVDSGQHSDDDSDDLLAASTAALRGSHAGLDVLDDDEDNINFSVNFVKMQPTRKSQVRSDVFPSQHSETSPPPKPSSKSKSASIGDLRSDSSVHFQENQLTRAMVGNDGSFQDDVIKLEVELSLKMAETSELLSAVDEDETPGNLQSRAPEKLEKTDHVLREVKKKKEPAKYSSNRKSW